MTAEYSWSVLFIVLSPFQWQCVCRHNVCMNTWYICQHKCRPKAMLCQLFCASDYMYSSLYYDIYIHETHRSIANTQRSVSVTVTTQHSTIQLVRLYTHTICMWRTLGCRFPTHLPCKRTRAGMRTDMIVHPSIGRCMNEMNVIRWMNACCFLALQLVLTCYTKRMNRAFYRTAAHNTGGDTVCARIVHLPSRLSTCASAGGTRACCGICRCFEHTAHGL